MAKNIGKIFEEDFALSVPEYVLLYRLPDAPQAFHHNQFLRFSKKNPFDYLLFDSMRRVLYALEMKTVGGVSISFEREDGDKREIHRHQIDGLLSWDKYDWVVGGFVIWFRGTEQTIFLGIREFFRLTTMIEKSSFRLSDLDENDIIYTVIRQEKKRTRYRYDVDGFLGETQVL